MSLGINIENGNGQSGDTTATNFIPNIWVDTIAEVRAITELRDKFDVGCYANYSVYQYDETSTAIDDGSTVIKPDIITGAGRWIEKNNTGYPPHIDIINPTVNDDINNYFIGQHWINTVSKKEFVCLDNSIGAAIWKELILTPELLKYDCTVGTGGTYNYIDPSTAILDGNRSLKIMTDVTWGNDVGVVTDVIRIYSKEYNTISMTVSNTSDLQIDSMCVKFKITGTNRIFTGNTLISATDCQVIGNGDDNFLSGKWYTYNDFTVNLGNGVMGMSIVFGQNVELIGGGTNSGADPTSSAVGVNVFNIRNLEVSGTFGRQYNYIIAGQIDRINETYIGTRATVIANNVIINSGKLIKPFPYGSVTTDIIFNNCEIDTFYNWNKRHVLRNCIINGLTYYIIGSFFECTFNCDVNTIHSVNLTNSKINGNFTANANSLKLSNVVISGTLTNNKNFNSFTNVDTGSIVNNLLSNYAVFNNVTYSSAGSASDNSLTTREWNVYQN